MAVATAHTLNISPDPIGGRFTITTPHGSLTTTLDPVDLVALIAGVAGLPCFARPAPTVVPGSLAADAATDASA